jgi:toxin-antitoxin system PIN domain toxin
VKISLSLRVKISLPDVNVLLPLAAEGHIHHPQARSWFSSRAADSVVICRVTQMGLLRLLTNSKVLGEGVRTIRQTWKILRALEADPRVMFAKEPEEIHFVWADLMNRPGVGASSWTDAYLPAFARQYQYQLVTFDRDFNRWPEIQTSILVGA